MISHWMLAGILFIPLANGILIYILNSRKSHLLSTLGLTLTLLLSFTLVSIVYDQPMIWRYEWWTGFEIGWRIDRISAVLITLVSLISLLIHLFSGYYMKDEPNVRRYYAFLGVFTSSMLGLLAADHLILLFVFWELVGFTSYLLIGYWYDQPDVSQSAKYAFLVNRVADAFLLGAIMLLLGVYGKGFISDLPSMVIESHWAFWISIGLLIGAMGKSAQFPFFTWLPRAMVGPTPVSALIHAATMVTAGVYLLIRTHVIFPPEVLIVTALVGAITLVIAAVAAMTQSDIKAVLAYSTVSQLGYMVLAIGVGAHEIAFFHLWTHAFFKAGLFLTVGAIIHSLHTQDMGLMGGLKSRMPYTFYTYMICMLSLIGLPFFTGFMSKDAIIAASWSWAVMNGNFFLYLVPIIAFITALLTAFYMTRQMILVFWNKPRSEIKLTFDQPFYTLKLPFAILAMGSVWIFYHINPFGHDFEFLEFVFIEMNQLVSGFYLSSTPIVSMFLVAGGFSWAYAKYGRKELGSHQLFSLQSVFDRITYHAFYVDYFLDRVVGKKFILLAELTHQLDYKIIDPLLNGIGMFSVIIAKISRLMDRFIVDGSVRLLAFISRFTGNITRGIQSKQIQVQFLFVILGLILMLSWFNR